MTQLKALSFLVLIAFSVDLFAYDGSYRRGIGRDVRTFYEHVSTLDWY